MALPETFTVPVDVALARPAATIPSLVDAQAEPKLDGFRTVIVRDGDTRLWSRQKKELTQLFPEIVNAAARMIPDGCVVDGETVIWSGGRLSFDAMQRRMARGERSAGELSRQEPASFAAFDLLAIPRHDIRRQLLRVRRELLEELGKGWLPPLSVNSATRDPNEAAQWMGALHSVGVEGLVIKALDGAYSGGRREWVKVKHRDTIDTIAGAVIGTRDRPQELVVGFRVNGKLRIAGRSSPLSPVQVRQLAPLLLPPLAAHPWPPVVKPGAISHFSTMKDAIHLTLIEPMVVEVSADIAWSGESFRHSVRFLRARPDVDVWAVTIPAR